MDDRDQSPGVKFKDADLLGLPLRITIGERDLSNNQVEISVRKTGDKIKVSVDQVVSQATKLLSKIQSS